MPCLMLAMLFSVVHIICMVSKGVFVRCAICLHYTFSTSTERKCTRYVESSSSESEHMDTDSYLDELGSDCDKEN